MIRTLKSFIESDLKKKMVFVAGPRQCGKTTLAKEIIKNNPNRYFNWDSDEGRDFILKKEFPTQKGIVVFDEIHKFNRWRNYLKGLYDTQNDRLQILVTGSAKLDYYRKGGDSLQGRYHLLRMHPLTLKELGTPTQDTLEVLLKFGGFPEPFFLQSETETRRWSREYRTRLVREELSSLEKVNDLSLLEMLLIRLPECVGSPLSINSLREDLQVAHQTVSNWIKMLSNVYAMFLLRPMSGSKIQALKKEAKHYHFDWTMIADSGPRFENLMACHLLKWCHFIEDTQGFDMELTYFRDREKREVDFVILKDRRPIEFIECKFSDREINPALRYLKNKYPQVTATQVSFLPRPDTTNEIGIRHCDAVTYLREKI